MIEVPGQVSGESTSPDIIMTQPKSGNHGEKYEDAYNSNADAIQNMALVELAKINKLLVQQLRTPSNNNQCCSGLSCCCCCDGK